MSELMTEAPALAFDLTRCVLAAARGTIRGIDAVDLAYAKALLAEWPGPLHGVLPGAGGLWCFDRSVVAQLVHRAEGPWRTEDPATQDDAYRAVRDALLGRRPPAPWRTPPGQGRAPILRTLAALARPGSAAWWKTLASPLPPNAIYLNTGHAGLAAPGAMLWHRRRADVTCVTLIHDLLSLDYPEYFPAGNTSYFNRVLRAALSATSAFIVPSHAVAERLGRHLRDDGRPDRPILVAHPPPSLPVSFVPDEGLAATPYFIVLGTIEPRKNHLLLLQVWREIAGRGGAVPKLLLVGGAGWEAEQVADMLDRCEPLRPHLVRTPALPAPALARLIGHARALLMPSFGEGYGLPVVEALALGTPVIAADIPVLREASQGRARYLPAHDGLGWLAAVRELAEAGSTSHRQACDAARLFRTPTPGQYFDAVFGLLAALSDRRDAGRERPDDRAQTPAARPGA